MAFKIGERHQFGNEKFGDLSGVVVEVVYPTVAIVRTEDDSCFLLGVLKNAPGYIWMRLTKTYGVPA